MRGLLILLVALGVLVNACRAAEPTVKREEIVWSGIWVADNSRTDLPRVLLIGDSICDAYYGGVAQALTGKALVAKLATSCSLADSLLLDQVKSLLSNYKFAVIHLNNGLHGLDYTEAEYQKQFPNLLKVIKRSAPGAKLILATSTPMRTAANLQEFAPANDRVKARNRIVAALAAKDGLPVDDLYRLIENHPEYWLADGIHFTPEGQAVEAKQVAKCVLDALAR